ncbi:MAG TPA: hypothetical protein VLH80_07440 [Nitrospiraceae bacterium]|nr:hypothetical protein [Nitrospiraceae bacterium]
MANKYAKGSRAWCICGRSGMKFLLKDAVFDGRFPNMRVHPDYWEDKHPQEFLPKVEDPVALYRPSPETIAAPTAPVLTVGTETFGAPVLSAAVVAGPGVQLTWTLDALTAGGVSTYSIYRATNQGAYVFLASVNAPTMTYIDTALTAHNSYGYFVVPVASNGAQGAASNILSQSGSIQAVYNVPGVYTWQKPTGTLIIDIPSVIGGGGGGGSGETYYLNGTPGSATGGGGGGYISVTGVSGAAVPATVTITVGAGGAGGQAHTTAGFSQQGFDGADGGNSSFGTYVVAHGGQGGGGGQTFTPPGGAGGTATTTLSGTIVSETGGAGGPGGSTGVGPYPPGGSTTHAGAGGGTNGSPGGVGSASSGGTSGVNAGGIGGVNVANFAGNGGPATGGTGSAGTSTAANTYSGGGGGGGGGYGGGGPVIGGGGGNGGGYGGGGGGGGLAINTANFGNPTQPATALAGGTGGGGVVVVKSYLW